MATLKLRIENMSCGACIRRVMQTLNAIPKTHAEEVQLGSARVQSESPQEDLVRALTDAGFPTQVDSVSA